MNACEKFAGYIEYLYGVPVTRYSKMFILEKQMDTADSPLAIQKL